MQIINLREIQATVENFHTKKFLQRLNQQCIEVIFDEYLDSEVVFV